MSEPKLVPKGLYGIAVCETSIAKSSSEGSLTYRGYDISDLFANSTFEEAAFLVLNGSLPSKSALNEFSANLKSHWKVPDSVYNVMRDIPMDAHPMDMLRTAVSALGANERKLLPESQKISLIAKMPWLVANSFRISKGKNLVQPDQKLGTSDNLLYMLTDRHPEKFEAWAFERELILYMEHDLNASAFAVRVIASTLADVYAACTGGVAALRGPLHGGANEAAMDLLLKLGKEKDPTAKVQEMLARGEKVMGFGHRVYKIKDPRAQTSKELLKRLLKEQKKPDDLYNLCDAVEKKVWEAKKLPANLDYYAAPIFYELGIPIEVYTPIFAASRVVGWVSHYNEQLSDNKLFRPDAIYNGKSKLEYLPIEKRS
ncbi:MAG: citrate synthase/methylcitrate synthase [Nitrososphaerota archaeon]|jgi:citrate synthase|nr:citrate synthase/methylcitrate synthase [Nitrososphaerota archaeon]